MQFFHVNEQEIQKRLFNIFVGISLGNKLLTPELCKKYLKWAHENTKENVIILIADKIDIVNWEVFRKMSTVEAQEKVEQKAYGISGMFDKARRILAKEEKDSSYISNVHIIFWGDILNEGYANLREILEKEYKNNLDFKKQILYFVGKYIELRKVQVDENEKDKLAQYILDELPTLLGGVLWNNTLYNLILYPTYVDSGMSKFVLDIRGGKYFDSSELQLRQICVMVEDYLKVENEINFNG